MGIMTTIFVIIIITIIFITITGFAAPGRSEGGKPHHREPRGGGGG